jgi:hypothetical protein
MSPDSSNVIEFEPLLPGEKKTKQIAFEILLKPWRLPQQGQLDFEIALETSDGRSDTVGNGNIKVAPFPYTKKAVDTLLGVVAGIASTIALLVWARAKQEFLDIDFL